MNGWIDRNVTHCQIGESLSSLLTNSHRHRYFAPLHGPTYPRTYSVDWQAQRRWRAHYRWQRESQAEPMRYRRRCCDRAAKTGTREHSSRIARHTSERQHCCRLWTDCGPASQRVGRTEQNTENEQRHKQATCSMGPYICQHHCVTTLCSDTAPARRRRQRRSLPKLTKEYRNSSTWNRDSPDSVLT